MLLAKRTSVAPSLDGTLTSEAWSKAVKSGNFVDMAAGHPGLLETTASVLWDDENLYLGFWVEEPYPTAHLTERDSLIFSENDIELFIDGGDCYYELEINALGTIYEVFFIWRDAYDKFDQEEFNVHTRRAYSFGGDFDRTIEHFWDGNHPRKTRWAFTDFDLPGLKTAVSVQGTLNDSTQRSRGWTCEIAIPWQSLTLMANGRSLPPQPGDVWNLFLGRFQKIVLGEKEHQAAWCVTPHGRYDTHMPEKFTPVRFE